MSSRRLRWWLVVCMVLQSALLLVAPVLSTDTFRYIHEARAQRVGLAAPYLEPPATLSGLRTPLPDDGTSARVEHRDVAAAYLPAAQLLLLATVAVGDVVGAPLLPFRLCLLAGLLVVVVGLWRQGRPRSALLLAVQPLVWLESSMEAHLDALSIPLLGVVIGAVGGGVVVVGVALGVLFHVKPVALLLWPLVSRRVRVVAVIVAVGVSGPHLLSGVLIPPGLVDYGARWRAHALAFPLLEAPFSWALHGRALAMHVARTGLRINAGDVVLVSIGTVDTAAEVGDRVIWLDAALAAKALALAVLIVVVVVVRRRWSVADPPGAAGVVLFSWLLLSPTLHPWYGLWLVVPAAMTSSRSLRWTLWTFAGLLPLLHQSDLTRAATGVWEEALWPRVVLVGGSAVALIAARLSQRSETRQQQAHSTQP